MTALYLVSAWMIVLGLVLANYGVIEGEKVYARGLVIAGIVLLVLPSFWK